MAAKGAQPQRWRLCANVFAGAIFVSYPLLVWFGLSQGSPREMALVLLCIVLPLASLGLRDARRKAMCNLAVVPGVTALSLGLAAWLNARDFVLLVPAVINAVLLLSFGLTLRPGAMPMIERFARLQLQSPSPAQLAWCRMWTWIWCLFFLLNGSVALALALAAPLSWWTLYNGLLAYLLMAILFASEWIVRRRRFAPHG